jgi:tellurite resistance protein TerC
LSALMHRFVYLKYALALVLIFIGCKIFYHGMVGKVPALLSLGVTFGLLLGGVVVSLIKTRGQKAVMDEAQGEQPPSAQTKSAKKEEDPQLRV